MEITATELKQNLGKYLELAIKEDIYVTKNGKTIVKLSNPNEDRLAMAKSLIGIIKTDMTLEQIKDERLSRQ